MEKALLDIAATLTAHPEHPQLDERALTKIVNRHNKRLVEAAHHRPQDSRPLSKKRLMAYYLDVQRNDPERWAAWAFSPELQQRLVSTLKIKPRRTASGVATVTVLTKPWPCSSACLYCPNDIRMPKSYLADEPACQRAELSCFDPYVQVARRLHTLEEMGHDTSKTELIVLGGTWSDYPLPYQIWFVRGLFAALSDGPAAFERAQEIMGQYEHWGISCDPKALAAQAALLQARIDAGEITFNEAFALRYGTDAWRHAARGQTATWPELKAEHARNVDAQRRNVGLVIETRPELCTCENLATLRRLGCTKVQMGVQSLDPQVLAANHRRTTPDEIADAFEHLRLFGFKTHVHAMVNLLGSTPEADIADYRTLMDDVRFRPDEVKLYPCVLIGGTGLGKHFANGTWRPYERETLVDVLVKDACATPPWCRISRMIRDFSAPDIMAGNKNVNLRQLVEARIDAEGRACHEIRHREVALGRLDPGRLRLEVIAYETSATSERFLQWVTPEDKIAGFCRLSLPHEEALRAHENELPIHPGEAMIRELHVYGRVTGVGHASNGTAAQHRGLGAQLVEHACKLAREAGYARINVISAVGTRGYYRRLGFLDKGLYQQRELLNEPNPSLQ